MRLLVATRSRHKLREIRAILAGVSGLELVGPEELGLEPEAEEEGIEIFETFEENALAKARYFFERSGIPTVADDSGLSVDHLDGRPGVHSRRFASTPFDASEDERDRANNNRLLELLNGVPAPDRSASYHCVATLVDGLEGDGRFFHGTVSGRILSEPRGNGGFGYDPLFFVDERGHTFAELSPAEKDAMSHRGKAFRALGSWLEGEREGGM